MSLNPSEPSVDELLEQLKKKLPDLLFTAVTSKLDSYQARLQHAELKIQVLEERLRLKRIEKYGPGSEKLSNEHGATGRRFRNSF